MERYLEESNKVQSIDNGLLRAYDHEQSLIEGMQKQFIEEGFKQGIEQGIEQGIVQGIEQGIEQGISKNRLENARALIKDGFDRNKIIKSLNLTDNEIKELG